MRTFFAISFATVIVSTNPAFAADTLGNVPHGPINCSTAKGDIRALNSEKEYAKKQQAKDVLAVTPAGALFGLVTGTENQRLEVLSGEYEKQIDARIAAISSKCKV
ncbi:hypothetical protein [Tropicibacter sp. Alg240-R139]|uniref:hypothetical protein n=1 Tax=Tropicibacter sp. Alg240-R139 TaxID=2305991 RepID=UPI0013DFC334|nr:hypothetical protein [Tropicibacter sp. Alg240-R139]